MKVMATAGEAMMLLMTGMGRLALQAPMLNRATGIVPEPLVGIRFRSIV